MKGLEQCHGNRQMHQDYVSSNPSGKNMRDKRWYQETMNGRHQDKEVDVEVDVKLWVLDPEGLWILDPEGLPAN